MAKFSVAGFSIILILASFIFGFVSNSGVFHHNSGFAIEDIYYSNGELL